MSLTMHPTWISTSVALTLSLIGLAEGCYRRTAERVMTSTPSTMLPEVTSSLSTHKMDCTPEQANEIRCQNRGTCFAIDGSNGPLLGCTCLEGYTGNHCQFAYIPPFEVRGSQIRTAHIAAGLSVFILIVFALLLALYVWHRLHRRDQANNNAAECHPLNENGKAPVELPALGGSCPVENAANLNDPGKKSDFNGYSSKPTEETVRLTDVVVETSPTANTSPSPKPPNTS